jgi:hypothetical protein
VRSDSRAARVRIDNGRLGISPGPAGMSICVLPVRPSRDSLKGHPEAVAILLTIGLVLLAIVSVGVVLAWAEWRPPPRDPTAMKPRLTSALLATEDEEALR